MSLYDLLWQQYASKENYLRQNFIYMETVDREFDYERTVQLIQQETLHHVHRGSQQISDGFDIIRAILIRPRLLFAMLVLGGLERLLAILVLHGFNGATLLRCEVVRGVTPYSRAERRAR